MPATPPVLYRLVCLGYVGYPRAWRDALATIQRLNDPTIRMERVDS